MPSWPLSLEERETQQYTSRLYCSAPPVCTAVRLPFVRQYASHLYGSTFQKILRVGVTGKFPKKTTSKMSIRIALLVAPYCAIPRDYLSDTPLLRAMGFLVSQHGQLGAIPPPPFLSVSPLESIREVEVRYPPPPQKGYLSDTCAIPYENKAKSARYPPLRYYLERVWRDMGGVSRTGPLRDSPQQPTPVSTLLFCRGL